MKQIKCHTCGKSVERIECHIKRYKRNFCSRDCAVKGKTATKYTKKVLKFVQDNIQSMGYEQVEEKIGVNPDSLRKKISDWRKEGIKIPHMRYVPIGTVSTRNKRGVLYRYTKTADGWSKPERISPPKEKFVRATKSKEPSQCSTPRKMPKPEPKRLPDKVVDMSQYRYVRLDSKTIVLRKIA